MPVGQGRSRRGSGVVVGGVATAAAAASPQQHASASRSLSRHVVSLLKQSATSVTHLRPGRRVSQGSQPESQDDGVDFDEEADEDGWARMHQPSPTRLVKHAAVLWEQGDGEDGGRIICIGREADRLGLWELDCDSGDWQRHAKLRGAPSARFGHSAVLTHSLVVIYGGWGREETHGSTYCVDLGAAPLKRHFTRPGIDSATRPPKRAHHSSTLIGDDTMLVFGGSACDHTHGTYSYFDDLWELDLTEFRWAPYAAAGARPAARAQHSAGLIPLPGSDRSALVIGAGANQHWALADWHMLDLQERRWRQLEVRDSPYRRVACQPRHHKPPVAARPTVTWGGALYIYGGGTPGQSQMPELWGAALGHTATGDGYLLRFAHVRIFRRPRRWHAAVVCRSDGGLFLVGGADESSTGNADSARRVFTSVYYCDTLSLGVNDDCRSGTSGLRSPASPRSPVMTLTGAPRQRQRTASVDHSADRWLSRCRSDGAVSAGSGRSAKGRQLSAPGSGDARLCAALLSPGRASPPASGLSACSVEDSLAERTRPADDIEHMPVQTSRLLGKGSFGRVYQGLHPETGQFVAVKQIKSQGVPAKDRDKIKMEIDLLRDLDHPNIVKYLGSYVRDGRVNIVMEYVSGGSLLGLIQQYESQGGLPEVVVRRYTRQTVGGVDYLHSQDLMHRDIKPANILVDAAGVCKVADFGASKHLKPATMTQNAATAVTGTPLYMAPEMISGRCTSDLRSDVWSVGCTVIEMLSGQRPWLNVAHLEAIPLCMHIANTEGMPPFPPGCSEDARCFLLRCLERSLAPRFGRATCKELLNEPFLSTEERRPLVDRSPRAAGGSPRAVAFADEGQGGATPTWRSLSQRQCSGTRTPRGSPGPLHQPSPRGGRGDSAQLQPPPRPDQPQQQQPRQGAQQSGRGGQEHRSPPLSPPAASLAVPPGDPRPAAPAQPHLQTVPHPQSVPGTARGPGPRAPVPPGYVYEDPEAGLSDDGSEVSI
eukprot:TRINITY_DN21171_c0_g1_i1.p1 TRINITY_DN21171_c0_g1~~TRINITY_DN21171_c0_g1_i1.p1  ORF type:complete len:993 (+),score=252.66 TRINITY_DN21171_c0_g1_i1:141-3119(+)